MAEGYSFDPAKKIVVLPNNVKRSSLLNKNVDVSLDDIVAQKKKERLDAKNIKLKKNILQRRKSAPAIRRAKLGDNQNNRTLRKSSPTGDEKRPRKDKTSSEKPRDKIPDKKKPQQIDVPEESLRKFLRGEGIKMDKNLTYKIMSYPKE